jgi:hypothetical protein
MLNNSSSFADIGSDESYGVSAFLGWEHHRDRTNVSVTYSGSYGGMARYSELNAFNHAVSLSASRQLTQRWTFSVSAVGQDATVAQTLFQPATFATAPQVPASFNDFAALFSVGQFSNAQIASTLTGAPILQSPVRTLLLGNRILSYAAQAGLTYAYSPRLTLQFSSFTASGQTQVGGQGNVATQAYAVPRSLGGQAGLGASYMLSPRTTLAVDVAENRIVNHYQRAWSSMANVSLGRKMGEHWVARIYGGGTLSQLTENTAAAGRNKNVIGGAMLGLQTYRNTFTGSYDRSSWDSYGFAIGTENTAKGSWSWHPRASRWTLFADISQQQLRDNGFANLSGWTADGGLSVVLSNRTSASLQFVHMKNAGTYAGGYNEISIDTARFTLSWNPVFERGGTSQFPYGPHF